MVDSFRHSLIGLMCLSMVGCANMSNDDVGAAGVIVGLGALAALVLLSGSDDDDRGHNGHGSRDSYRGGNGNSRDSNRGGNGKGHSGRR